MLKIFIRRVRKYANRLHQNIDSKVYNLPTQNKFFFNSLLDNLINNGIPKAVNFDFASMKRETLSFVRSMQVNNSYYRYKFASSQEKENLYSSIYACLIYDMYGEINNFSKKQKKEWTNYFDSFQNEKDGLWYDEKLKNELYEDTDCNTFQHILLYT